MGEPKLRFKADDGSDFPKWEEKMFWDVFANLTNNTLSRECLNAESGQARNIHYGDVLVKYGAVVDVQRDGAPFVNPDVECKRWDCLKDGDVVIADTAEDETVGKAVEISNAGSDIVYSGLHTIACRPKEEFAPGYLGNYINSMSYHDQLRPYMQGIKVTSVSKTNIGLTHLLVPTLPEQRKIADFLSAVDAVIAAQQAEVDAWEQRKKGVMQKLFSQEVRFKADDGSDFPDWEEKTLGELCSPLTYGMNAAATKFDGENRYIRITDIDDETHALLPNDIVSPSGELDDKYLVKKGDILLARTGASTGKSYLYHQKDVKLFYAGFLIKAHVLPSSDDYFIYSQTLTDRYWKWVKTASMRSGQPRINANEYASYSFAVPSLPEQRKIADCLASMDEVIQKSKDELAKWRELKKGLLQQMFV